MKPLLCLLALCLPLALATQYTHTVYIDGGEYRELLYAQGPLTLSYIVEVLGGASSGSVDVFWVNDENYRHFVNGEYFPRFAPFSQNDTAYASLPATECTCDDSFYHLVVLNKNLFFKIKVWYTVEFTPAHHSSGGGGGGGGENIIPGLLAIAVMVLLIAAGAAVVGLFLRFFIHRWCPSAVAREGQSGAARVVLRTSSRRGFKTVPQREEGNAIELVVMPTSAV